ncbi:MAG: MotA/TolQ/ExbB proton channel family protein [Bacteroidetes bacterium]|jgi:biopolymer transport protein ExbB|nr:MotA/TolQ/ExbB proton channel family protein [Bacteroidota bacterium]
MLGILLQSVNAATTVADSLQTALTTTVATGINTGEVVKQPVTEESFNLLSMIMKGGIIIYPLILMLLLAIYVLVERLMVIRRASKKSPQLLASVKDAVHKGNIESARTMCVSINTPESMMIDKGLSRIGQPVNDIREAMNEAATIEIGRLEKNMGILNITGRIAPMFGFIGTIIGVIKIFYDIALQGTVEISVISTGLYEKMVSSCSGLVVGVFAFIAYHWMNTLIDKFAHKMEESRMNFLDILNEPSK